ncbi:hypothetical protein ACPA2N_22280 [Ectopseudomonas hydrolytica]|uniref:hypothetical protein n=1 Tax=Ectopseudomonas hydrolytica TaxID=2493633 RepID=UPI003C2DB50E
MNLFDEPVSLLGTKLVRAFAKQLESMPEDCRLPQSSFDTWSAPLAETNATESQMTVLGVWYAKHHKTCPSLPYIRQAAITLVSEGALPDHRIANRIERDALAILKTAELLGMSADDCANALVLAGALAHLSTYRRRHPDVDRAYLRMEIEGIARMSDYVADEILDEIQQNKGDLRALREYLFDLPSAGAERTQAPD